MVTFEQIQKANAAIKTVNIKGKDYSPVQERITAFRKVYPEGFIRTQLLSVEAGVCIMRAEVGIGETILGTGTAYENEKSSYINKTSYIENCETSAVGRALGMAGFGIDASVASLEEVANAINNQQAAKPRGGGIEMAPVDGCITAKQWKVLQGICKEKEKDPTEILLRYGYSKPSEVPQEVYNDMVKALEEGTL